MYLFLRCIFEKIGYDRCIETIYRKVIVSAGRFSKLKLMKIILQTFHSYIPFHYFIEYTGSINTYQELVQIISNKKIDGLYTYPWLRQIFVMITYLKIHS